MEVGYTPKWVKIGGQAFKMRTTSAWCWYTENSALMSASQSE